MMPKRMASSLSIGVLIFVLGVGVVRMFLGVVVEVFLYGSHRNVERLVQLRECAVVVLVLHAPLENEGFNHELHGLDVHVVAPVGWGCYCGFAD